MPPRSILTVEDDPAIRRGVVDALQFSGYRVQQAGNACEGARLAREGTFDLMLLDVLLPDGSGLDLLAEIRERSPLQPVILLTARGEEHDRVAGLKRGADDYVVKPFSLQELLARVEAVLRRAGPSPTPREQIDLGRLGRLNLATCEFECRRGRRAELSPREVQLIHYLSQHAERVVSREELLQNVWGIDARGVTTRTIDMHVARLREKLGDDAAQPTVLVTVRGRGYRWGVTGG